MRGAFRARAVLSAALLAGMMAGGDPARAAEFESPPTRQAFWLPDGDGHYGLGDPAVLSVAVRWSVGDAAAVLTPGDWQEGLRDRLLDALLASGASVLELPPGGGAAVALRRNLRNALVGLREIEGAGLVVAIGVGEGGDAALEVAAGPPQEGHVYAAAVRLGPGEPAFLARPVDPAEAWPVRAPMLCALLAGAQPGAPGFVRGCTAGLVPAP